MPVIPALRSLRQENYKFKTNLGYKGVRGQPGLHSKTLSQKKVKKNLGVVVHACPSSCAGSISRRTAVQARADMNVRPYLKNNENKKGWEYGSSGRISV
jgi:pyruvate formate-lyase activating enzyme-like uncharacterized protein